MAPKKNKSKIEEETIANMSTGWRKSKMSESLVRELESMGLLQEQGVSQWRAGEGEDYPMEGTLETIMFRDFVERGLTLPVSEFFYRLLQFWGIQLHHLTPQSILHLSIFTHFCEAFLGILPHFHLFQHFFFLVPIPNATNPAVVGGCELVLRPENRGEYLVYDLAGQGAEWKKFWFHVGNFESPLPERTAGAPQVQESWSSRGPGGKQVEAILCAIAIVKKRESLEIMWSSRLSVAGHNLFSCDNILPLDMKARRIPLGCPQSQWLSLK